VLDERTGFGALVENLGLAFVNAPPAVHGWFLAHGWLTLPRNA
jgi:hypothetical protein